MADVTSDLHRGQIGLTTQDVADQPLSVPDHQHSATMNITSPPTTQDEITTDYVEEVFSQVTEKLMRRLEEMSENISGVREKLANATTHRTISPQIPPTPSLNATLEPLTAPDSRRDVNPNEAKVTIPLPDDLPPIRRTHRKKVDDSVDPPRGRSVEACRKLRSARFARSDWPT